jgi:uncharacterized caspase-like protein
VLAVGVNDYGDKAKDLKLRFAVNDAQGVASALVNTQEGSLYSEVLPMYLHDRTADKAGIFDALAAIERNMGGSNGQDLAVVLFSGQGTAVENKYYLFPYGVDNSSKTRLVASAIAASDLQHEVQRLAERGRVLLLFDACSGRNCDQLRATVASNNVTVLTSSTGDELSRESEVWQHGALTKVLLDALSSSAHDVDTDHNGVISMSELAGYVAKNLPILTAGQQRLGLDQRFEGDIFIAGL